MQKDKKFFYKILVVGTGGTGGYFLKEFSRFLSGNHKLIHSLCMIDGDTVEEHNLARQCFQKEDVGQFKAAVLAEVLSDAFDTNWKCYPYYLQSVSQLEDIFSLNEDEIPVILGCVDNHGCRLVLEEYFQKSKDCIYFDSANELYSGEVVFSYKINGKKVSKLRSEIFPDILKGDTRNVTELSCEELNTVTPQHITVNMFAGLILLSAVTSLLEGNSIKPGMTCFSANSMSSEFIPLMV